MDSLSNPVQGFKDVNGKFHDNQEQADRASAQIMLDKANPGGTLSTQALANLYARNPSFFEFVTKDVENLREQIRKQAQEQEQAVENTPKTGKK